MNQKHCRVENEEECSLDEEAVAVAGEEFQFL